MTDEANLDSTYFEYSAALRIVGEIKDMSRLSQELGLEPTHQHFRGQRRSKFAPPYSDDMWSYTVPIDRSEPLTKHLLKLRECFAAKRDYLKSLRASGLVVNIFCGYRSNSDTAGFSIEPAALRIFSELDTPLDVSVIVE